MDHGALGEHDKRVSPAGLLRHRFWIGWFFVSSLFAHRKEVAARPRSAILALRYPANVLLGCALPLAALDRHFLAVWTVVGLVNNAPFLAFVRRACGAGRALVAVPLIALETVAMLAGLTASAATLAAQRLKWPRPRSSSATASSASVRGQSRSST